MDRKLIQELSVFMKDASKCVKVIQEEEKNIREHIRNIPSDVRDAGVFVAYRDALADLEVSFSNVIETKKSGNMLLARRPRRCSVSEFLWFSFAKKWSRKLARGIPFLEGYVGVMRELVSVLEDYQDADEFIRMIEVMRVRDELVKVVRSAEGR